MTAVPKHREDAAVLPFRAELPAHPAPATVPDRALLARIRGWALMAQLHPPLVLHRACAAIAPKEDVEAHGLMLLRALASAGARRLVLHPGGAERVSDDEFWLLRLLERLRANDGASARFLIRRRVDRRDHRMALFLADRLAEALDAVESKAAR